MKLNPSEFPFDKKADRFYMGIIIMDNGEKFFSIVMTDVGGDILAHGAWPRQDWEDIKFAIDDLWLENDNIPQVRN